MQCITKADWLIKNIKVKLCLFIATESEGTSTLETFETVIPLLAALKDINENKRRSALVKGSGFDLDIDEDIEFGVDFEDECSQQVKSQELYKLLIDAGMDIPTI